MVGGSGAGCSGVGESGRGAVDQDFAGVIGIRRPGSSVCVPATSDSTVAPTPTSNSDASQAVSPCVVPAVHQRLAGRIRLRC